MTMPTTMTVAGMQVPIALVPRIVAALRARYPAVTAEISDDHAAVQAVLAHWVINSVVAYETDQALAPLEDELQRVRDQFTVAAERARANALTAVAAIVPAVP